MFETLYIGPQAEVEEDAAARVEVRSLIVFELGDELYGARITDVAEIRALLPIMPLPAGRVAAHILGLVNLRGVVLPAIDLRRKFGLAIKAGGPDSRLVLLKGSGYMVALWVAAVRGLARIPLAEFQPAPKGMARAGAEFCEQVTTWEGRMLIELNLRKVLANSGGAAESETTP